MCLCTALLLLWLLLLRTSLWCGPSMDSNYHVTPTSRNDEYGHKGNVVVFAVRVLYVLYLWANRRKVLSSGKHKKSELWLSHEPPHLNRIESWLHARRVLVCHSYDSRSGSVRRVFHLLPIPASVSCACNLAPSRAIVWPCVEYGTKRTVGAGVRTVPAASSGAYGARASRRRTRSTQRTELVRFVRSVPYGSMLIDRYSQTVPVVRYTYTCGQS